MRRNHLRARAGSLLTVIALGALGACSGGGDDGEFIALQRDFAGYQSWTCFDLGDMPLPGHPPGPRRGCVNHIPPAGSTSYPVGTIIVKEIHNTDPARTADYDLFAMVKRGGNFNANGAVGWEYFTLRLTPDTADGTPAIVNRGINFSGADPYSTSGTAGCNGCHAATGSEAHDHILNPILYPENVH